MSETDTPRTDACRFLEMNGCIATYLGVEFVPADRMRKLERALANCKAVSEIQTERVQKLEVELAEWRVVFGEITDAAAKWDKLTKERDSLLAEKDLWTSANRDMRRIAEERNKFEAERNALAKENQWHLASESPAAEGSYIIFANCAEYIGYWSRFGWYADLIEQHEITHWRKHFQPPKGET